jgi:hypothetical protein
LFIVTGWIKEGKLLFIMQRVKVSEEKGAG